MRENGHALSAVRDGVSVNGDITIRRKAPLPPIKIQDTATGPGGSGRRQHMEIEHAHTSRLCCFCAAQ